MKIKTSELTRAALNWVVASIEWPNDSGILNPELVDKQSVNEEYPFGEHWSLAGPIIGREGIDTRQLKQQLFQILELRYFDTNQGDEVYRPEGWKRDMVRRKRIPHLLHGKWLAKISKGTDGIVHWSKDDFLSDSLLEAAMRCFIANKIGDEVEVPNHLL